jgi:hypothetical protein
MQLIRLPDISFVDNLVEFPVGLYEQCQQTAPCCGKTEWVVRVRIQLKYYLVTKRL